MIRTLAELEDAEVAGRVLVLAGEVTKNGIMPLHERAVYLPDRDRRIGALVRQKQPAALVTVSAARG